MRFCGSIPTRSRNAARRIFAYEEQECATAWKCDLAVSSSNGNDLDMTTRAEPLSKLSAAKASGSFSNSTALVSC